MRRAVDSTKKWIRVLRVSLRTDRCIYSRSCHWCVIRLMRLTCATVNKLSRTIISKHLTTGVLGNRLCFSWNDCRIGCLILLSDLLFNGVVRLNSWRLCCRHFSDHLSIRCLCWRSFSFQIWIYSTVIWWLYKHDFRLFIYNNGSSVEV
jgi:hypothetical protein